MTTEAFSLVRPSEEYLAQIAAFRGELLTTGSRMDGCGPLRRVKSPEGFVEYCRAAEQGDLPRADMVPATQFLYVREADGTVVGMLQVRHRLNRRLAACGGHVGYCVRPSERRKGYATAMLAAALPYCRALGIDPVVIFTSNEASARVVRANGGVKTGDAVDGQTGTALERFEISWNDRTSRE
ncbi:MAG: GNAT family N-acetyltransferase [Clostridia bacterium]|nr:GNAT family N-acetyltransferase [Clostridia bacterium]